MRDLKASLHCKRFAKAPKAYFASVGNLKIYHFIVWAADDALHKIYII